MGYSIEMIYQNWTRTVLDVNACVILIARFQLMGLSTLYFGNGNFFRKCLTMETIFEISETDMSDISIGDINLGDNISDSETDDSDINIVHHTLPFKVMGVAHSNQSQTHLLRANIKINEEHEVVTAHLVPEPQNERDSDAISVQINYGDGPCHVGYIPRELTKYIHPLLKENAITKVDIGHIIFSLKWYRVGFYMKIPITRVGRWEPYVVSKAMRVK